MRSLFLLLRSTLRHLLGLGPVGLLAAFWLSAPGVAGLVLLYELGPAAAWLRGRGDSGLLVYACVLMFSSGLGLLPTTAQAVLGGWVFGPVWGGLAAAVALAGGTLIGFCVTRLVTGTRFETWIEGKPEAAAIRHALVGRGFISATLMIALLRVPPQAPFAFMNLLLASSGVRVVPFVVGSVLGMLPRTLVLMLFASAAAHSGAADIQTFLRNGPGWPIAVAGVAALIVVLAVIGAIARRTLVRLRVDPLLYLRKR
jgi:uncharacterized membrane protein YdjX (TVP38/TMEM64 family)